jgi:hypothetical protein
VLPTDLGMEGQGGVATFGPAAEVAKAGLEVAAGSRGDASLDTPVSVLSEHIIQTLARGSRTIGDVGMSIGWAGYGSTQAKSRGP